LVNNFNLDPDIFVTGHYAINSNLSLNLNSDFTPTINDTRKFKNPPILQRAIDKNKCQTFFLSRMPQEALQNTIFPVGSLNKNVVKHLAINEFGLEFLSKKRESMGICFIGKRTDFSGFIGQYTDSRPGKLMEIGGDVLGGHLGLEHFTIGKSPKDKFVKWKDKSIRERYFWSDKVKNKPVVVGSSIVDGTVYLASKTRSKTDARPHLSRFNRFARLDDLFSYTAIPTNKTINVQLGNRENLLPAEIKIIDKHTVLVFKTHTGHENWLRAGCFITIFDETGESVLGNAKVLDVGPSADEIFGDSSVYPFRDEEFWTGFLKNENVGTHPDDEVIESSISKQMLPR